ncbi:hypothetical protein BDZ90DRAFT_228936 [Jaminaea rosea]|uniref:Nonmuscle myosin heavy chain b n=1 Tax=Jaminaea rosea TaxID=1569628 RepID=A0A316V364_9BASI|nr:hypothetical protein BDZ90DRAFT_228936 [Jaminaea rosea]PWN29885.1 hypothetical protein BDZ90DRAFT_228936 [Jaminaea rosea]
MPAAIPSSSSQPLAPLTGGASSTSAAEAAAAAEFASKKYVWIPSPDAGYLSAYVINENPAKDTTVVVCVDDGSQRTVQSGEISRQNPPRFELSENIADLTFLSEAGVSHCLRQRYQRGLIYTYSGLFLVAVNPYHNLPIYTDSVVAAYKGRRREENPPHVYAVADEAMRNMLDNRENQSLLITGESGAGKTENTKKVIQYLAAVAADMAPGSSGSNDATSSTSASPSVLGALTRSGSSRYVMDRLDGNSAIGQKRLGLLERQILQANPILEAFGNAQTIRNNNSSRFGKFVRIEFTSVGAIAGANIDWYLLEKSRVHNRSEKERSFHVFYQLLRSGERELLDKLLLTGNPGDYAYLKGSRQNVEGMDDTAEWQTLKKALDTVGFSGEEQHNLLRVVASILQVGNIELASDRSEQARITNPAQVEKACHLLGVPESELTKALLRPRVKAGREWVTQSRTGRQVVEEMAALCKTLYEKTFARIVARINTALDRPTSKSTFIGVLDIAGFEIFEHNSFEQLCINYTNEKLQQFFNHHMFVLEQEEYSREGIEWDFVNFGLDLQPTIDLIESSTPVGILSCLDEECIMPKATDETFTEKCARIWGANKDGSARDVQGAAAAKERGVAHGSTKFVAARFATGFTVRHYAGNVEYRTEGWLDKNKDPLNDNLTRVMAESTDRFVAGLFAEYLPDDEATPSAASAGPNGVSASPAKRRQKRGAFRTLAQKHKEQLTTLMNQLGSTQPHFVRCIVPNATRTPGVMALPLVLEQLRCNGVLEGIRIARLGYPNRLLFNEFRTRYEVLTPDIIPRGYMDGRKAAQRMIEALALDGGVVKIGLTKIFFKAGVLAELEERRDALLFEIFSRFQAGCRMFTARRQMKKVLNRAAAVRTIQRNARLYVELRDWPWWQLYSKVRPLLKATRHDEELKRKEAELALATERAQRDAKEREALAALKAGLESEKQRVEEQLDSERALLAEKDQQLTRSREREAGLEEDLAAMQRDVDQLDDQLERAMRGQKEAEGARLELQAAFDQAAEHLLRLEAGQKEWQEREATLTSDLSAQSATHADLLAQRDALVAVRGELERKVKAGGEDLDRHQKRLNARVSELEGLLAAEQEGRGVEQSEVKRLRDEVRKVGFELEEARRAAEAAQGAVKEREGRVTLLEKELAEAKTAHETAQRQQSESVTKLRAELATAKAEVTQGAKAREALQRDLDETRRVIEAKSSEDVKQREVQRIKEEELAGLRNQMGEHAKEKQAALEQVNALRAQLDGAKRQHAETTTAQRNLTAKLDEHTKKAGEAASELAATQAAHRATRGEMEGHKQRADTAESALEKLKAAKGELDAALSGANAELQDHEDALIECERSRSAWQAQAEETAQLLEAEQQARAEAEQAVRRSRSHAEQQATAKDAELAKMRNEIALLSGDLRKAQSLTGKTTIEHVHVYAEAKRKTDDELREMRADLEKLGRVNASLEKVKMRLMGENEDLVRENARLNRAQAGAGAAVAAATTTLQDGKVPSSSSSSTALRGVERERDEALSHSRRTALALESLREQSEARIVELERQLSSSHLAHTNTFTNLQDIVRQEEESKASASRPGSPFKRKLLEELSNGHRALEADIAAKSRMLKGARVAPRRSNGGTHSDFSTNSNGTGTTPASMKRTSTDLGGVAARNTTDEAQRLQRVVKEQAIDLAALKQGVGEAEQRARYWQREAERLAGHAGHAGPAGKTSSSPPLKGGVAGAKVPR